MTTGHTPRDHDGLPTAEPFPGVARPVFTAVLKSCLRCGIESTEERCFNCGRPLVDRATFDWLQSSNPSNSEC